MTIDDEAVDFVDLGVSKVQKSVARILPGSTFGAIVDLFRSMTMTLLVQFESEM